MTAGPPLRLWTVDEFDRMFEIGILAPRGHELIDGTVYTTSGFVHRWSVRDYGRMVDAELITLEEHAELVEGLVVDPPGFRWVRASIATRLLNGALRDAAREFGQVSAVGHIVLDDETLVHPELAVLRFGKEPYVEGYPRAEDLLVAIEIVEPLRSAYTDMKRERYARAAVPELWRIESDRGVIVGHTDPRAGEYQEVREYGRGEVIISPALGGREVRVEDVLGPEETLG